VQIDAGEAAAETSRRELCEVHCRGANERDHLAEADLLMVILPSEPLAPGDIELAPLTPQTVLGLLRR
jgi:hypothetical protein